MTTINFTTKSVINIVNVFFCDLLLSCYLEVYKWKLSFIRFDIVKMPKCGYKDCKNSSKSKMCKKNLRYFPFPKSKTNLAKCLLWLEMRGNQKLNVENISKNIYICEKHFQPGDEQNPIPYDNQEKQEVAKLFHSLENPPEDKENCEHNYSKCNKGLDKYINTNCSSKTV
ncbi:hypothetical protein RN001_005986 [Aquatica leii]|uniref:THAP-type domain-containing protein n=1 Tax=Aquatica leii TaxID=1421715 RepID=A0AAN7Q231_9COLE|nr:hypothetical protein RN001_005986 [Aquatica leii]